MKSTEMNKDLILEGDRIQLIKTGKISDFLRERSTKTIGPKLKSFKLGQSVNHFRNGSIEVIRP